jgi:peptidoglycan/LPS O-acetylase OafA/YrhL
MPYRVNPRSLELGRIITRGRQYIAEVDGLRFIAIMGVMACHLSAYTLQHHMHGASLRPFEYWASRLFGAGAYGVQLFFVLSGFLLAMPFAKWRLGLGSKPALRTYYLRRLTRLEPPYVLAMIILFIGGFLALGTATGRSHWPNLLASLIYQHNLIFGTASLVTGVAWSLEIEVQFYILAPVLAVIYSVSNVVARRAILLFTMIAAPILRSFLPAYLATRFNSLPWHIEFFATGFLLADLYLVTWKEAPRPTLAWDLASILGWPVLLAFMINDHPSLSAPSILLAYVGAFRGRISSWLVSRPLITVVGGMCYSIYLLHFSVISVTGRLAGRFLLGTTFTSRLGMNALVALPAIIAVTGLYFVMIERPCMDPAWPTKVAARIRQWFAGVAVPASESAN